MPSADDILRDLTRTAHEGETVALAWHVLVLIALILTASGARPSRRLAAALLALPAVSVSALAFTTRNMFNGIVFAALAATLPALAWRAAASPLRGPTRGLFWLGAVGVAYALVYPHFAQVSSPFAYALFAPVGVLPCPTLALMIGLTLLAGGFQLRGLPIALALAGVFYAVFGVVALGVVLDLGLLVFALGLLYLGLHQPSARQDADERARIDAFLASKRIALIGASSDPQAFSRYVMKALVEHGIRVVPVHPSAGEIAGEPAFATIGEVRPSVDAALIMTSAATSAQVVDECAAAGVSKVWLHRGVGTGAVSQGAIDAARRHQLSLVSGRCPLMFLAPTENVHRVHAELVRLAGHYPH